MTEEKSSLLVVVIDTNPMWWGQRHMKQDEHLMLTQCLEAMMVFASSHLMMNHKNKLAVIAAHTNGSKFLYPLKSDLDQNPQNIDGDQPQPRGEKNGKYELFAKVENTIREEIFSLMTSSNEGEMYTDSLVSGALLMALCYIHRLEKEATYGENFTSRILTIKGSEDNPSQYMNFMNAVFSSQKQNVVLDACILDKESSLFQQACDITGGIYLKIPQMQGLLQYLLWVFLPDPATRNKLVLPPRVQVDYRAACFCDRNLIDIGYVCSVCLSIFCKFSPICSTCQTKFTAPPKLLKKKLKRSSLPS